MQRDTRRKNLNIQNSFVPSPKNSLFCLLGMTLKWKVLAFTESIFPEIFVTTSVLKNTNCSLHSTDHRLLTEELANLFWKTLTQICTSAVLALQYTAIKAQIKNRIAKCNPRKAWSMQTGLLQKAEKWRRATNLKKKKGSSMLRISNPEPRLSYNYQWCCKT